MGHVDDLEVSQIRSFEKALHQHLRSSHSQLLNTLKEKKALDDEVTTQLDEVFSEFVKEFKAGSLSGSSDHGSLNESGGESAVGKYQPDNGAAAAV